MKTQENLLHTELNGTASFDSGLVKTGIRKLPNTTPEGVRPAGDNVATEACRFALSVTGFTGTSMLVEVFAVINGIDHLLVAFTSVTGVTTEIKEVADCPSEVKIVGTAVAITDFDATITSNRLV